MSHKDDIGKPPVSFDKLITRGGGGVGLTILLWMGNTLTTMQQSVTTLQTEVTKVTTELSLVSPKDVQASVMLLQRHAVTKEDVRDMLDRTAPWVRDKGMILESLRRLETRLDEVERKANEARQ